MVNKLRIARSATYGNRPAVNALPYGTPYFNQADMQFGVVDSTGTPRDVIGVPVFSATANYPANYPINRNGILYISNTVVTAGPWNASQWAAVITNYAPSIGGGITINGIAPSGNSTQIALNKTATSDAASQIVGMTNNVDRWAIALGDSAAESGSNVGSNFAIARFNDAGTYLEDSLIIYRSTGNAMFSFHVLSTGGLVGCSGATAVGIGYADGSGAGGNVGQATSKTTPVTVNTLSGQILTAAGSIAANSSVAFTMNNSKITPNDMLIVHHILNGTMGAYNIVATMATAGSAVITIRNLTAVALNEQIYLRFFLLKCALS